MMPWLSKDLTICLLEMSNTWENKFLSAVPSPHDKGPSFATVAQKNGKKAILRKGLNVCLNLFFWKKKILPGTVWYVGNISNNVDFFYSTIFAF